MNFLTFTSNGLRRSRRIVAATILTAAGLGLVLAQAQAQAQAPNPNQETPLVARGLTEPIVDVLLSAAVPGIVTAKNYREGQKVKAGDVILELDKQIEELEVNRRKLVMDMRKLDLDNTQTLYEKTKSVPKEELDKKRVDYNVASVEYRMAQEQLQRRLVVAPHDGVISDIILDVGESTEAYSPLIRLVNPAQCRFKCDLDPKTASLLRVSQNVRLLIDSGGDPQEVTGVVSYISPVADQASSLIHVRVLFENPDGRVRPGLPGTIVVAE